MGRIEDMDERGLLHVWDMHNRRQTWRDAVDRGGNPAVAEKVIAELGHVSALDALAANRHLVDLLMGRRWYVIRDAREAGASWSQIGEALGMSKQGAQDYYRRRIDERARVVPDIDDADRARAVLDEPEATRSKTSKVKTINAVEHPSSDPPSDLRSAHNQWAAERRAAQAPRAEN
jgi:hypothetical protein